jgi:voltage-gated potassium channel
MTATPAPSVADPWGRQAPDGQVTLSVAWETFLLGLALLSMVNLVLLVVLRDQPDVAQVVVIGDIILTAFFALDVLRRISVARDRRAYFLRGYGWLDALSVLPMLRVARLLRVVRLVRTVQRMGGRSAAAAARADLPAGGFLSVLFVALLMLEFGSLAILLVEHGDPEANILDGIDAMWWVLVTMATVGYGDFHPVTDLGRGVGAAVILVGVGIFGTFTGYVARLFLSAPRRDGPRQDPEPAPDARDGGTGRPR